MHRLRAAADWLSDPIHLLVFLLSLLPILLVFIYVESYRQAVPYIDEWNLNGRIAIATADGKVTPDTLLFVAGGHRTIFTNLATVLATLLANWDLRVQGLLTLAVAIVTLMLLILHFRRSERGGTTLVLVPFALMLFAVYRTYIWWSARFSHWTMVSTMFLLALWVGNRRLTWRAFGLLLVLGWCTTYTSAAGMLVWPLLLPVMWLAGNRDWRKYLLWLISGAVAVALYLSNSGTLTGLSTASIDASDEVLTLSVPPPGQMIEFMFKFIGNGLLADASLSTAAAVVGIVGLALFVAFAVLVWRRDRDLQALLPWLALALFALGSGAQIGVGRIDVNGVDRALVPQYGAPAALFWIALIAVIVMTIRRYRGTVTRWPVTASIVLGAIGLSLYGYSTTAALQGEAIYWERQIRVVNRAHLTDDEQCVVDFVLTRRSNCLNRVMVTLEKDKYFLDELATRRIGIFATMPVRSLLPQAYQPGSPIILITQTAWLNVHIRDLLLAGVPETSFFHVVLGNYKVQEASDIPNPLHTVFSDNARKALDTLANVLGRSEHVWLMETHDTDVRTMTANYIDALVKLGYHYDASVRQDFDNPQVPLELTLLSFSRHP